VCDPIVVASWPMVKRALWVPCITHTSPPKSPPDPFLGGWACGCEAWNDVVSPDKVSDPSYAARSEEKK